MSDTHFLILLVAAILITALQLVALLRKPRIELPPELLAQLQRLEQQGQATRMEVAKNDGALDGMANQLQGFTQATSHSLETVRQTVDEKLAQAVNESRTGRTELLAAFSAFEVQLAQRLAALFGDVHGPRAEAFHGVLAGRLAVAGGHPGGGDFDVRAVLHGGAEEALSHGAAADVTGADKKDVFHG